MNWRALRYFDAGFKHLRHGARIVDAVDLTERALSVSGLLEGRRRAEVLLELARDGGPLDHLGRAERQESAAREAYVFIMNTDGSDLQNLTDQSLGNFYDIRWSPDATQLGALGPYNLKVFDLDENNDGTDVTTLYSTTKFVGDLDWKR